MFSGYTHAAAPPTTPPGRGENRNLFRQAGTRFSLYPTVLLFKAGSVVSRFNVTTLAAVTVQFFGPIRNEPLQRLAPRRLRPGTGERSHAHGRAPALSKQPSLEPFSPYRSCMSTTCIVRAIRPAYLTGTVIIFEKWFRVHDSDIVVVVVLGQNVVYECRAFISYL
ncbi:hypothetical protein J6590_029516 [Homalodisca vitripennis]|nr:hypothetical protein J6590_029516 [Homalodisca vitripennis]